MDFNKHASDFQDDFTIEFNVKNMDMSGLSDENAQYESESGAFAYEYSWKLFKKIKKYVRSRRWTLNDWSNAGRSAGWFALLCNGDETKVTDNQKEKIEVLVNEAKKNYNQELLKFYNK